MRYGDLTASAALLMPCSLFYRVSDANPIAVATSAQLRNERRPN
jgi:hypothetical protein